MKTWAAPLLEHLGLSADAYLGAGSEAQVYALDEARIARLVDPRTSRDYLERLERLYSGITRGRVPFALPEILEVCEHEGALYTIEARIPGSDMMRVVDGLEGQARAESIAGFVGTAAALRGVELEDRSFHRPLDPERPIFPSFSALLASRIERAARLARPSLREDIPSWDLANERWRERVVALDASVEPTLVHGDLFLGNVMSDEAGAVTGVVDFSNLTMVGDWRLDAVSALIFLDQLPTYTPEDTEAALDALAPHRDANFELATELYQGFYALYYAPFANPDDPGLYEWCVRTLARPEWSE